MITKLLRLFDSALYYSKDDVVSEYDSWDNYDDEVEKTLLDLSIYQTGEKIGFFNYSPYNLEDVLKADDFNDELMDYIDSFSDNLNEIIYEFDIDNLKKEDFDDDTYEINSKKDFDNAFESILGDSYNILIADFINELYDKNLSYCDLFSKDGAILFKLKSNELYAPNINKNIVDLRNAIYNTNAEIKNSSKDCDVVIANLAFTDNESQFGEILKNHSSNLLITLSSEYFDENINELSNITNPNHLKAIISLPIHKNNSNMILISVDANKNSSEFILIDESDCVMHENINDWSFISKELVKNISKSYNEFSEYENGIIVNVNEIISQNTDSELLSQIEALNTNDDEPLKRRVISNQVVDEILNSREKLSKSNIKALEQSKISPRTLFNNFIYGKKRQDMENLLYKDHKKIIEGEVKFLTLGELTLLYEITDKNEKDTLLISTCKTCNSKIVHYNRDIDDFNGEIYIEVNITSSDLLLEYLYVYLNSTNGLDELFYFSKGNEFIRAENIQHARIALPPKNVQKEIVKAVHESNEFFKSVELLKKEFQSNILDYKNMLNSISELRGEIEFADDGGSLTKLSRSWQHVYNGLIWPLAISYLSATKGGFETVEKLEKYLILFEFVAAFNFIILLSGLPDDVYSEYKYDIWNARSLKTYQTMTFGKWVVLTQNISEIYNNHDFTSKLDSKLFNTISSSRIIKILNKAKDYRNEHAHGTFINSYEAQDIIDELDVYLEDIFEVLEVYSDYKLIYITGKIDNSRGKLKQQVIQLNGPCAQPIYEDIIFDDILNPDCLYLYNPKNNKKLLIKDSFMKFSATDDNKKHWALFIYYMCDRVGYMKTNAHYKCFQSKEEDIIESISTFEKDIMG